jgi:hypothetical protein
MALGIDIEIERLAMFVPIVLLMEAIPISINGLGIREGAFAFFLKHWVIQKKKLYLCHC